MDVDLQCFEAGLHDYERPSFDVLKATLQYPAPPDAKAAKLADDIRFICRSHDDGRVVGPDLMDVWFTVIDVASCVPPDHPWQISLARAVDTLRGLGDTVVEGYKVKERPPLAPNLITDRGERS